MRRCEPSLKADCTACMMACITYPKAFCGSALTHERVWADVMSTDRGLTAIAAGCRQLQVLRVNSCLHITDASLSLLASSRAAPSHRLQNLIELDLKFAEISDGALKALLHRSADRPLQVPDPTCTAQAW